MFPNEEPSEDGNSFTEDEAEEEGTDDNDEEYDDEAASEEGGDEEETPEPEPALTIQQAAQRAITPSSFPQGSYEQELQMVNELIATDPAAGIALSNRFARSREIATNGYMSAVEKYAPELMQKQGSVVREAAASAHPMHQGRPEMVFVASLAPFIAMAAAGDLEGAYNGVREALSVPAPKAAKKPEPLPPSKRTPSPGAGGGSGGRTATMASQNRSSGAAAASVAAAFGMSKEEAADYIQKSKR